MKLQRFGTILLFSMLQLINPTWYAYGVMLPKFTIDPSLYTSNEGDRVILSCAVDVSSLSKGQEVVWRRDSDIISSGENVKEMYRNHFELTVTTKLGMYVLVILKAIRSDADYMYSCAVVDEKKAIVAETDAVSVIINSLPAPQYPDCTVVKDQHREGEIITMTCTSEKVTPAVNLRWYRDGNLLSDPGENPASNGDLVISRYSFKPTKDNNGDVYVCSQTSLTVTRNCTVGPLDILYEPSVSMQASIEVEEGSEALLVCSASANPTPFLYTWSFIPNIEREFYKLENKDQVVRITNVRRYMNKTMVICTVSNEIGSGQADSFLIVKEAFVIIEPPVVHTVGKAQPEDHAFNSTAILSVAGGLLLFTALLVGISLCYFHMCKRGMQIYESPFRIAQPEVYFEPKDNVAPLPLHPREGVYLKRHVAIQVSPDMDDESVYAEIEEVSYKTMMRYSSAMYSH